jgi:hypothetical protein
MILTYEQMIADVEKMLRESCAENDVDYDEFLVKLATLLGD